MPSNANMLFISHGGGPLPLMGDPAHRNLVEALQELAGRFTPPSAILVISAHWETLAPTLTASAQPHLVYDYQGFPAETYDIEYPASGSPALAQAVHQALSEHSIDAQLEVTRGLDHGVFVPLTLMFPDASIPCVEMSLVNSLNPETHLSIGKALQRLEWDNLLVIGSGLSFHNLRAFFSEKTDEVRMKNQAFEHWLRTTVSDTHLSESDRYQRLLEWEQAPYARFSHPREEHLLPLHVVYGMAGRACDEVVTTTMMGAEISMYRWGK